MNHLICVVPLVTKRDLEMNTALLSFSFPLSPKTYEVMIYMILGLKFVSV